MSNENISVVGVLALLAGLVGIVLLFLGFANMAGANFSDPMNGLKQWIEGILQIGIGASLILAAIGAAGVIASILSFILAVIRRDSDGI